MAIHLSGLPGEPSLSGGGRAAHFPRLALLRVGFTEPAGSPPPLVRSYRTLSPLPVRARRPAIGGFLSVALSCGSPRLAVSQHPALWSPDLPRHGPAERPVPRPPGRLTVTSNCATTGHVKVTGQRIGRVSSMSGGARQLFDPEAPPEAAASERRTASGGAEPEDRRGVHSIGGLYEQVEGALNQAFPRNRHLWVRGEIQHVSDHRSGHLYLSLVDPEDDGAPARPGPGRRAHPEREVLAQLVGAAAARAGQGGHRARRGDGRGPARLARPLPGQGRDQPHPRRDRRHRAARAAGGAAGPAPAHARGRGAAAAQRRAAGAGGRRCTSGWSPARAPRAARTSSASSRARASGSASRTCRSPCRAPVRRPPSPGRSPCSAGATATSSPWSAAGERGRTWPPSRPRSWPGPWPARPSRSSPGIGHTGDETRGRHRRGAGLHHADRVRAADRGGDPAVVGGPRGGAGRAAGPPRPGLPRRRPGPRHPGARSPHGGGAATAPGAPGAPGAARAVRSGGRRRTGSASSAARLLRAHAARLGPLSLGHLGRQDERVHVVAPAAGRLRRGPAARARLQPDAHGRRARWCAARPGWPSSRRS